MSPARILALAALLVGAVLAAPAHAQRTMGDYEDLRDMPDRPAAARATALLETINRGDAAAAAELLEEALAPMFRDAFPMEEHVGMLMQVREQSRGYDLHGWRKYDPPRSPDEIVLIVRNRLTESWEGIIVRVEPDEPHRIVGIQFSPARPPSDLPPLPPLDEGAIAGELRAFAERLAEADAFSGTVLVAKNGRVLFEGAYGLASKRFNVPNDIETRFNLGARNKMITAVSIAQLVERGELSYDDSIADHLSTDWLPADVATPITVGHLLNHTSGLGSYFNATYWQSSRERFRKVDDYQPLVAGERSAFPPGTDERYSNTGFLLLGAIIESVTGQDYFDYVRANVYGPAGMTASDSYDMDRPVPNLAIGYSRGRSSDGGPTWENNIFKHVIRGGPAGGGFSTVRDLLAFDQALRSGQLVSAEATEVLWTPRPASPAYGYGFGITRLRDDRIVGHGGGFPGISAKLDMYLESGYTVVVLSNYDRAASVVSEKARELIARRVR
jgi:CubicO group peptidase (beta-lactamase class C family)